MIERVYTDYDEDLVYADVYVAENQAWDAATLKELRDKYNIYYNKGIRPMKIIPRDNGLNPLVVMGYEDDGRMWFVKDEWGDYKHRFDSYWIDSITDNLNIVKDAIKEMKKTNDD